MIWCHHDRGGGYGPSAPPAPPSPQRHDTRKVPDEPLQGCPGGIIADEPEEHSLVAEFGMYYK